MMPLGPLLTPDRYVPNPSDWIISNETKDGVS
jgi:hypothetical protein